MRRRVLLALLVVSGAAALSLEVVWTRWMSLALGASSRAAAVVLAVFMAGIGLGALAAGRIADRRPERAPLLFAGCELGIALWALLSIPLAGSWLPEVASRLADAMGTTVLPVPVRAALAVALLAPPTLLMGASLPLLLGWSVYSGLLPARSLGGYYAANTVGGAAGVLLATFVLIDRFGLARTVGLAALADGCVAAVAFFVFRRERASTAPIAPIAPKPTPPAPEIASSRAFGGALAAYATSGFVGLGLEVVAHRIVSAIVGSSVYSFTTMLAAFLLGIAAGSLVLARPAERMQRPGLALGISLGLLAVGIQLARRLFAVAFVSVPGGSDPASFTVATYTRELAACLVVLLPSSFLLGAVVPVMGRIAAQHARHAASRLGLLYAGNTAGAVLGALVAGFVLIPRLGSATTVDVLCVIAGTVGAAVIVASASRRDALRFAPAVLALAATGMIVGHGSDPVRAALQRWSRGGEMLAFREGPVQAAAAVADRNDLQLDFRRIVANQTSFAATHLRGRRYMSLLGHLPVLWAEAPRSALVICFGTGTTVRAIATHPAIERIDVAEISPEVIGFAPLFAQVNENVLQDPRVRLALEDGRHVVQCARRPWDVITLEPPPPRDTGVVSLYTAEFYRACRAHLSPAGVMAQWIPLESQSDEEVRMLARTFAEAFPHALAFLPVERDLLLLGSGRPLVLDPDAARERMGAPAVRAALSAVGFDEPADLVATAVADRDALLRATQGAALVTDDRPRVEYFVRFGRIAARPDPRVFLAPPQVDSLVTRPLDPDARARLATARSALLASLRSGWARTARREEWMGLALEAVRLRPHDPFYLWSAALSDEHLARLEARARQAGSDPRLWLALGLREAQRGRGELAIPALRRTIELGLEDPDALHTLGTLLLARDPGSEEGRELIRRSGKESVPD